MSFKCFSTASYHNLDEIALLFSIDLASEHCLITLIDICFYYFTPQIVYFCLSQIRTIFLKEFKQQENERGIFKEYMG